MPGQSCNDRGKRVHQVVADRNVMDSGGFASPDQLLAHGVHAAEEGMGMGSQSLLFEAEDPAHSFAGGFPTFSYGHKISTDFEFE